jgi:ketosteroid isomerase-like protein
MRRLFLTMALLTAIVFPAFTQTAKQPGTADAEQAVLKLTRDWLDAEERHDRATLRRIIADDFQGTAVMGRTVLKDDVIPREGTKTGGLFVNLRDVKARVFGETAIVTGSGESKSGEKGELRFTVFYVKRGESWQMVAGHLSAVPRE